MMTLEQRKEKADNLRRQGYNCAQCVVMAFADATGLTDDTAARIAIGLGGGVGGQGEICGVASGMAIVAGMQTDGNPSQKAASYKTTANLVNKFFAKNGAVTCRKLKGKENPTPCNMLINDGVGLLQELLEKQ